MIIHEEGLVEGPVCGSLPLNSEAAGLGTPHLFTIDCLLQSRVKGLECVFYISECISAIHEKVPTSYARYNFGNN